MRFEGTSAYVATDDLKVAVNAAIALERPLLVKGEPGTGKTVLAIEIAKALGAPLIEWHIKSTTKALQGLYEYDAVTRLRDSQLGDTRVKDIRNYIRRGKLWEAFVADERPVLLIDEIDKADTDFQDDLLDVLDQMSFDIIEIDKTYQAKNRPIIIITSNAKKDLSDPFLGRCVFHHIAFPDTEMMNAIVHAHFPDLNKRLSDACIETFYRLRNVRGIEKKPATRELINWIRILLMDQDFDPKYLSRNDIPYLGVLFKKSEDFKIVQRQITGT
jgi:MoxR-like ATPase